MTICRAWKTLSGRARLCVEGEKIINCVILKINIVIFDYYDCIEIDL